MKGSGDCKVLFVVLSATGNFILGFFSFLLVPFVLILLLPLIIYWAVVCKILVPIFRKDILRPAQSDGNSLEFLKSKQHIHPRSSLVTTLVLAGTVPRDELFNTVQKRWIERKDDKGELKHPEFRQYIEEWMGFMFWKQDESFSLGEHLYYFHEIEESASYQDARGFVDGLVESLINKPYRPQRSPWELHVIYNYKDEDILWTTGCTKSTVILFRCHHVMIKALGGGSHKGISKLFEESLFEKLETTKVKVINPEDLQPEKSHGENPRRIILKTLEQSIKLPIIFLHEFGSMVLPLFRRKSPWHIPDRKKNWLQLHSKSKMIPLDMTKDIQTCLETSFESVILSSIAFASASSFKSSGHQHHSRTLPIGCTVFREGQSGTNEMSTAMVNLPIDVSLQPRDRLRAVDLELSRSQRSYCAPLVSNVFGRLISVLPAGLAYHLFQNRTLPAFCVMAHDPSSTQHAALHLNSPEQRILTASFASGSPMGCSGVSLQVFTFDDHVHISATAESEVMNRPVLDQLLADICVEIDSMHEEATNPER